MKKLLRNRGLVERGASLRKGWVSKSFYQFFLRKACFHYYWNTFFSFFCLVNIHACCNQQICSFMWFTFYQKMMYYEISFPVTLYFLIELSRFLLLMTFISISISLKTSNILENKSQVFERSDCTITVYIMIFIIVNL